MRVVTRFSLPAALLLAVAAWSWAATITDARPEKPTRTVGQQLLHERAQWATERRRLVMMARRSPDFEVSLQLAAIAYGQDWRALERCALSEGYRRAERRARYNTRTNDASGSTGPFQFIASTFASTPFSGLDWSRQDVQAHAAAWMWRAGRRGEWSGRGC